jgi:mannose-6-phosphate isomerase-like protein (cupin superfamily)
MPDRFQRWDAVDASGEDRYAVQTRLIREVLAAPARALDELLALMRTSGESCVYLAGTRLDNDFGLGSRDLGLALSVLPEDGPKAAVPAYHPGSTEVYVVIEGALVLEYLEDGQVRSRRCRQHEVAVIPPGRCHRVRRQPGERAASLIVKTALDQAPAVVRCAACTYYPENTDCPLHTAWMAEGARTESQ